ncbi:putative molybdenum transport ATP-binding protein (photorepair protein PhrA) [Escherichia coli]|uniref:Putative molybdenum transport ATP-binding protein (Photorepair protein PhrA) n=1 Tax=Escherichia coli TaxID=562 RepID=A0A376TIB1_ECOLX|nr:putative molybdenum transport ATP-binding protein (photorepair protein PhrA) [Escherichia coli]
MNHYRGLIRSIASLSAVLVDVLISDGERNCCLFRTTLEDAPACITHRLEFVPDGGLYRYVLTKIY